MAKVLVFGTFDTIHAGHINFLEQAKQFGSQLVVVVARDETVKKVKGKLPKNNEHERMSSIKKISVVDEARLGSIGNKYDMIMDIMPDVICLGYDQEAFTADLKGELEKRGLWFIKIVRLRAFMPNVYKSSKLDHLS